MKRWLVFGNHVLAKITLPPRDRELLILRTGWRCRAPYEWGQHVVIARAVGHHRRGDRAHRRRAGRSRLGSVRRTAAPRGRRAARRRVPDRSDVRRARRALRRAAAARPRVHRRAVPPRVDGAEHVPRRARRRRHGDADSRSLSNTRRRLRRGAPSALGRVPARSRSDVTTVSDAGIVGRVRPPRRCGRRPRSRPPRVAYATSTPSCAPSGRSGSGRPSSTTAMRSPVRRANACNVADRGAAAAPSRSRHQPSGRLPMTLSPSTIRRRRASGATRWCSPPRARGRRHCAVVGVERRAISAPLDGEARARRDQDPRQPRERGVARAPPTAYHAGSFTCAHLSAPITTTS